MSKRAEELMIGDYFFVAKDNLCIRKGSVVEIRGIDADDKLEGKNLIGSTHCRPLDKFQFEGGIWLDYLEPIPLTSEILEKNGWVSDNYNDRLQVYNLRSGKWHSTIAISDDGKLSIEVSAEIAKKDKRGRADLVTFVRDWCDSFCVHELQHALKLCGINLNLCI